jgi:hypothetical protein
VLGSLAIQFCVLAILAWRLLAPPTANPYATAPQRAGSGSVFATPDEIDPRDVEVSAKLAVLDEVVSRLPGGTSGLVSALAETKQQVNELQSSLRGQRALEVELNRQVAGLKADLAKANRGNDRLVREIEQLQSSLSELEERNEVQLARIAELQSTVDGEPSAEPKKDLASRDQALWKWAGILIGTAAGFLAISGVVAGLLRWRKSHEVVHPASEESRPATNKD